MNPHDDLPQDPFTEDDAAYLSGALDDARRDAFETHLLTCPSCAARVRSLAPVAAALRGLEAADWRAVAEPVPVEPAGSLVQLVEAVHRRRRRLHVVTGSLAVAAAAVIAVLAVLLGTGSGSGLPAAAPARTMTVLAATPIRATAAVSATQWGTSVAVTCTYGTAAASGPGGYAPAPGTVYVLQVVDRDGTRHDIGSWTQAPGRVVRFSGGVALAPDRIARVEIALPGGAPLLRLTLG
ncbi:MAG: hypothetical protein EPN43_12715 [Jatrophihabitans sp.]|nr:MAG: hypothetical protein EPN43_12715 [Jatrophihabitans sp.]